MKIKCPFCNENFNLEDYLKDTIILQAFKMMPEFGQHWRLVFEYAELFHVGPPFNARKLVRILAEVKEFFQGHFEFQKRRYEISREGLAAALRTVCNALGTRSSVPLQNHNYLKKVAIGIAEEEAGKKGKEDERRRREAEGRMQHETRDGVERIADVSGKVRELLGKIG